MDLAALVDSWRPALRRPQINPDNRLLCEGVDLYLRWCAEEARPAVLDRHTVRAWVAHLLDSGAEPNTARARLMALKRFSAWLVEEDELDRRDEALLRLRATHRLADTPLAWLGGGGQSFGYNAADKALKARAQAAGIDRLPHPPDPPHRRLPLAERRRLRGRSDGRRRMGKPRHARPDRYTRLTASDRAAAEARNLNLGEW